MRWFGLIVVGGCFSPSPPAGAPCPDGTCPSGLVCSPATMTCEKTGVAGDAPLDTPPDTPDGCYGSGMTVVCPDAPLAGALVISSGTALNTTTSPACLPYHLPSGAADATYCVIGAGSITVGTAGRWLVTGTRPLVLVAAQVQIDGLVDVASHRNGTAGPNANPALCIAGTTPGDDAGGAGGSFGTAGGAGGASEDAPKTAPAATPPKPLHLRGGCPGGAGNGNNGGLGGNGGGALHIIATQLAIAGTVNASGEAGDGAGLSAGGGGGGSGGLIVLEAPAVTVTGRVFANGGGGGEGGGPSNGGEDGVDSTAPATVGLGGGGNAGAGGDGGDGASSVPATAGADGDDSGGGGGGGAGVIRVLPAQALGGSISPPPTT